MFVSRRLVAAFVCLVIVTALSVVTFLPNRKRFFTVTRLTTLTSYHGYRNTLQDHLPYSTFSKITKLTTPQPKVNNCERCIDPNSSNGIEDLFCIEHPQYIDKLKNPCWYERGKLRCLPYFHILGCAKCATTDLSARLSLHPQIVGPDGSYNKETLWWSWRRYGHLGYKSVGVSHWQRYLDYFDPIAEMIQTGSDSKKDNYTQLVTMDGSPPDFWDFRSWPKLPQNDQLYEPCVFTPHLMKHLYRDPKFILIFRNPTERLLSSYLFHKQGESAEEFDADVRTSLKVLRKCLDKHSQRYCFLSEHVYDQMPVRLHFGCYSMYLREWLQVFPRSAFLIVKTEEYTRDIAQHMQDIFSFLNLALVSQGRLRNMSKMTRSRVTKLKKKVGQMFPATRKLLDDFYGPYNRQLADLLEQDKFLWK